MFIVTLDRIKWQFRTFSYLGFVGIQYIKWFAYPYPLAKAGGMRVVTKHKHNEQDSDAYDQKYMDQLPEYVA